MADEDDLVSGRELCRDTLHVELQLRHSLRNRTLRKPSLQADSQLVLPPSVKPSETRSTSQYGRRGFRSGHYQIRDICLQQHRLESGIVPQFHTTTGGGGRNIRSVTHRLQSKQTPDSRPIYFNSSFQKFSAPPGCRFFLSDAIKEGESFAPSPTTSAIALPVLSKFDLRSLPRLVEYSTLRAIDSSTPNPTSVNSSTKVIADLGHLPNDSRLFDRHFGETFAPSEDPGGTGDHLPADPSHAFEPARVSQALVQRKHAALYLEGACDLPVLGGARHKALTYRLPQESHFGLERAFETHYPGRSGFRHPNAQPTKSLCFCLDGASDLPEAGHPNLASFSFSFAAPKETATKNTKEKEGPEEYFEEVAAEKERRTKRQFEPSPLRRSGDRAPSSTLNLPTPARREFGFSVATVDCALTPELSKPSWRQFSSASTTSRVSPTTGSPKHSENSPPRSARRVIRPDDWYLNRNSQTGVHKPSSQKQPVTPAQSRVQQVASQKSSEFAQAAQPFQTPSKASAAKLFTTPYSDEELLPKPLRVRKPKPPLIEEPDEHTPRITRANIVKYLASSDSLRDLADLATEDASVDPLSRDSTSKETRKARRGGAIYEFVDEEAEKESLEMDLLHPESAAAMTEHRREAVRLAKAQERAVVERCKRGNQEMPGYTFDELIGKGSFGRVYKGRQTATKKVVAIKVIDIDEADFHSVFEQKDEQIKDFNREIRILKQAQDSGAPNMNQMIEALPVHSQLWLVCEYCPGGSVKTLMRATNDRLAETYIVVVARELGKALKGLHEAGIMHRDIKAANVLIHEEGRLQLCDFGVATVLDTKGDKRKTFIGTPHWMPPELFVENPEYSDEVDVWEFGCTLYECALGKPPNSDLRERQQLSSRMRRLKQSISLPEHEEFSDGLRSLVSYTLSPDARSRPSMKDVLQHAYLLDTEETHPTSSLSQLVKVYYSWLYSGGQRASLFMPGGAVVSDVPGAITTPIDEWNFSTTEVFDKRISAILDIPDFSQDINVEDTEGDATPTGLRNVNISSRPLQEMTNVQKANFEARVKRGADLSNLFDQEKPDYEYKTRTDFRPLVEERRISDLPFRAMAEDRPTSIASNVIDLGDFDSSDYAIAAPKKEETAIQLADAATIRAKRGDSKGPRDSSSRAELTAKRNSSADDDEADAIHENPTISAEDFAFPPREWATDDRGKGGIAQDEGRSDLTSIKDAGRKTMDWSFASAMSAPQDDEIETQEHVGTPQAKSDKHATLDWSFSSAMAEADTGISEELLASARSTPARPPPLLRTMTQPVTSNEVHTAEEIPRPSTALSEARSESSMSSADFDPFALEGGQQFPLPSALDDLGVSNFYSSRGNILVPEHIIPYNSTVAGPAPYMLGTPARIGEEGFPGPHDGAVPSSLAKTSSSERKKPKSKKKDSSSSSSAGGRPRIDMPEAVPPSEAALRGDARSEVVESELSRLLGGLQASLAGASQALGAMRRPKRRGRGRAGRPSSSEWEDEESGE